MAEAKPNLAKKVVEKNESNFRIQCMKSPPKSIHAIGSPLAESCNPIGND